MKIEFVASASGAEVLALLVHEGRALHGTGGNLDAAASGALTRAMNASRFTGGANSTLVVAAPTGVDAGTIVLTGAVLWSSWRAMTRAEKRSDALRKDRK